MFILLVVERDTPCTSMLLAVEKDTPCTLLLLVLLVVKGIHNACWYCWLWKGIYPALPFRWLWKRIHAVRWWKGIHHTCPYCWQHKMDNLDIPCTSILLVVERDMPCTSILLAVEVNIPLHVHTSGVVGGEGDTQCMSIDGCWWCYSCYIILKNHMEIPECRNVGEKLVWHRHFYRQSASSVHRHFVIWVSLVPLVTD